MTGIDPSSHQTFMSFKPQIPEDHQELVIICGSCGTPRIVIKKCGKRSCIYCRDKGVTITLARKGLLRKKPEGIRFMTLTLKTLPDMNRETLDFVRDKFRKLIRRKGWKKYVCGGLYVIEITKVKEGFHYHFHILYQGKYFPYGELQYLWKQVTGQSYIIWLSALKDASNAFSYLLDYVTKCEVGNISKEEYDSTFKGVKLVQFFGSWTKIHGIKTKCKCKNCKKSNWVMEYEYRWMNPGLYIGNIGGDDT
jgi:hypothetical protein